MFPCHKCIDGEKEDSEILDILLKYYQSKLKLTVSKMKHVSHCIIPTSFRPVHLQIERAYEILINLENLLISFWIVRFYLKTPL